VQVSKRGIGIGLDHGGLSGVVQPKYRLGMASGCGCFFRCAGTNERHRREIGDELVDEGIHDSSAIGRFH
jgi:hypothetical protein